jgi:hypothetical protein
MLVKLYWILICLKPVFFKAILIKFMKVFFLILVKLYWNLIDLKPRGTLYLQRLNYVTI